MPTPYVAAFPEGTEVEIKNRAALEEFARDWKYHNRLQPNQMPFAGTKTTVDEVGYYHGGDPLYKLRDVPGVWHEACLQRASVSK